MRGAPEVGTCWRVPAELIQDYRFDDSPQVPCTEPRTSQTASVYQLEEPTSDAARALVDTCWDDARLFIDVTIGHWVPWAWLLVLPSREQVADGASFARCDVLIPTNLANTEFASLRYSVLNAAGTLADQTLPCLDRDPDLRRQPYVSCSEPRRYQATGQPHRRPPA